MKNYNIKRRWFWEANLGGKFYWERRGKSTFGNGC